MIELQVIDHDGYVPVCQATQLLVEELAEGDPDFNPDTLAKAMKSGDFQEILLDLESEITLGHTFHARKLAQKIVDFGCDNLFLGEGDEC